MVAVGGGVYTVAQLVETLRYKLESRGLDSRWSNIFFVDFTVPHGVPRGRQSL
jgi:hypothetical protein